MMRYLDLSDNNAQIHTHSTGGTAVELTGFMEGAFLRVVSHEVVTYVGSSKVEAESHKICIPTLTDLIIKLGNGVTSLWIDLATSKIASVAEIKMNQLG
jgi:hypothetical protein